MAKQKNDEKIEDSQEDKNNNRRSKFLKKLAVTIFLGGVFAIIWFFAGDMIVKRVNDLIEIVKDKQEPIYVAMVLPFEENDGTSRDMRGGIELCGEDYENLNIEFIPYFDEKNPDKAQGIAEEIVVSQALAVVGHYTSAASTSAGNVYQEAGIAAITGSATADGVTEGNEWYFRTIFTNQEQAEFLAYYIKNVKNIDVVNVVSQSPDEYSVNMRANFIRYYQELGGSIVYDGVIKLENTFTGDEKKNKIEKEIRHILDEFPEEASEDVEFTVLLLQREAAIYTVRMLKDAQDDISFIGADSIGSDSFAEDFRSTFPDIENINDYTDGIVAIAPMIFDVAGGDAQIFYERFSDRYNSRPSWSSATYYDATCAVLRAIDDTQVTGHSAEEIEQDRLKVRNALAQSAEEGIAGNVAFDLNGNMQEPTINVGFFESSYFISHPVQLRLSSPPRIYKVAYSGIKVDEITNIDIENSTFTAHFYLWFLSSDPEDNDLGVEFLNAVGEIDLGTPLQRGMVSDLYYRSYFITGDFKADMNFQKYPFDEQELDIRFRNKDVTNNELVYVIDYLGKEDISSEVVPENSGWKLNSERSGYAHEFVRFDNNWGSRGAVGQYNNEHSVITAKVVIGRDAFKFALKNMLPVILVSIVTYLSFFLDLKHISVVRNVVTGSLLTTAFIHSGLTNNLPPVNYFTTLDIMFYLLYGIILIEMIITILAQRAYDRDDERKAIRYFVFARIFFPIMLLVMVFWIGPAHLW